MRAVLVTGVAALVFAWPSSAAKWSPSATWLLQARCVHVKEGPWPANTGNGYFGGFQFSAATWKRVGGGSEPAFAHPGDPAYPFGAPAHEQLYRAWRLWRLSGRSWSAWGAIGASCSLLGRATP